MLASIRWRHVVPFVVVTWVVMAGVTALVPADVRPVIALATLIQSICLAMVAILVSRQRTRLMQRVARVMQRLGEGDSDVQLLPERYQDAQPYVDIFNTMIESFRDRLRRAEWQCDELAAVLEHIADGVVLVNEEGRVELLNCAAARMFDIPIANAEGKSFAWLVRDHTLIEHERNCREQGMESLHGVEIERGDVVLRASIVPLRHQEGTRCLVVLQDITRLRHLETVRRDFISNVSHELRTPLASLKALVETLRDGALDDPAATWRFLDRIEAEVDTMTQIVEELLELTRTESGRAPLRLVPTALTDIVLPPIERLRPQAERADLELTVQLPDDLPPVLADVERARQVVSNLVHNAIKFTPSGGKITVWAQLRDAEVLLAVQDTGVGISAEDLPRIFERFYKADRARSSGGTGLGLAIARHIVQAHGGRIWAESTEGSGSTFFFTLLTAESSSRSATPS
ncbi:MAG: ATP-binding protein [Anaerolineae bacterium]